MNLLEALELSIMKGAKIRDFSWDNEDFIYWDANKRHWVDESNRNVDGVVIQYVTDFYTNPTDKDTEFEVYEEEKYVTVSVYNVGDHYAMFDKELMAPWKVPAGYNKIGVLSLVIKGDKIIESKVLHENL